MGGWCFALVCHLPLSSKYPFCDISLMTCLRLITSVHTYVFFCASWSWFLDMQFFLPLFQLLVTSPLSALGGVLLLFLMLPWFDGVSYVFSICSYVLGGYSGWVPMHFGEIDHLPYRHSSFCSYFGFYLPCSIDQLFKLWCFMPSVFFSSVVCLCVPPDSK